VDSRKKIVLPAAAFLLTWLALELLSRKTNFSVAAITAMALFFVAVSAILWRRKV
jgi:hypothetical protein